MTLFRPIENPIVAAAVVRGWCSAPLAMRPTRNNEIQKARGHLRHLNAQKNGRPIKYQTRMRAAFLKFLRAAEEFTVKQFQNFLAINGMKLDRNSVKTRLAAFCREGLIVCAQPGRTSRAALYKKI